jgi:AbrB family looped-hinge helix DNA binding protein
MIEERFFKDGCYVIMQKSRKNRNTEIAVKHTGRCFVKATIQVRKRGVVTIPSEMREKYGIQEGDTYQLVDMDGIFVLTPMMPMVPELAREIERFRREEGVSMEDLMQGLREERERYHEEHYGED